MTIIGRLLNGVVCDFLKLIFSLSSLHSDKVDVPDFVSSRAATGSQLR